MSQNIDDEFEEIDEKDVKVKEDLSVPAQSTEEITPAVNNNKTNNFALINDRRIVNKKANVIKFLIAFADDVDASYEVIAKRVNITKQLAKKYIKDYTQVVLDAIENQTYPFSIPEYFNDKSIPPQQRLTVGHVKVLNNIIVRYNDVNLDAILKKNGYEDEIIEEAADSLEDAFISSSSSSGGGEDDDDDSKGKGEFYDKNKFLNDRMENPNILNANSRLIDVIRFGLMNTGQTEFGKIRKILNVFSSSPEYYLSDENLFTDLLEANGIKEKHLSSFMNWFKNAAAISPRERIGFLALANLGIAGTKPTLNEQLYGGVGVGVGVGGGQQGQGQNPFGQKGQLKLVDISIYDDNTQYLYHKGIYDMAFPPDHPINREAYEDWRQDKKWEREKKKIDMEIMLASKRNLIGGNNMMGGGGNMMGGGSSTMGSLLDEQQLFRMGMLVPEITYENGQKVTRWVPTGKTWAEAIGGGQGQNQQQQKPDQLSEQLNIFARILEAMKGYMGIQQPQQGGNSFTEKFMEQMMTMMTNTVFKQVEPKTTADQLRETASIVEIVKGFSQGAAGTMNHKTREELDAEIEMLKIGNDKEFRKDEIELKKKEIELKEKAIEEQKAEAKKNLDWIWEGLEKVGNFAMPYLGQIFSGGLGGGLGNMFPGGGGGGMNEIPPQQQFPDQQGGGFPNQQQPSPFDEFGNTPTGTRIEDNIPQSFFPNQQSSQPSPEQIIPNQNTMENFFPNQQSQPSPIQPPKLEVDEDDIENMSEDELTTLLDRIEFKEQKLSSLLNKIKAVKAKKNLGYNNKKKTVTAPRPKPRVNKEEIYNEVLKVPENVNDNYDGVDEQQDKFIGGNNEPQPQNEVVEIDSFGSGIGDLPPQDPLGE